jgi:hypothetical protein
LEGEARGRSGALVASGGSVVDAAREVKKPRTRHAGWGSGISRPQPKAGPPSRHASWGTKAQERKHRPTCRFARRDGAGVRRWTSEEERKRRGGPRPGNRFGSAVPAETRWASKRRAGRAQPNVRLRRSGVVSPDRRATSGEGRGLCREARPRVAPRLKPLKGRDDSGLFRRQTLSGPGCLTAPGAPFCSRRPAARRAASLRRSRV